MFSQAQVAEFKEAFQLMDHDKDGRFEYNERKIFFKTKKFFFTEESLFFLRLQ